MSNAFSNALALESVGELGIFNAATGTYSGVTHDDLVSYARTVAYKVFHNLKLGHTMSKEDDPLTVDGVSAANVWADHYEFVSENPLCGEWYRVPYPPTDAMKDAWNNDDSNDFNTAYLAMVHASPAADQCCGKCEKPDDDGPGEEDGPWAEGWEAGVPGSYGYDCLERFPALVAASASEKARADYEREHCRHVVPLPDALRVMIAEAVAAEREACAKVCEKEAVRIVIDSPEERAYNNAVSDCAAAIRARGEK